MVQSHEEDHGYISFDFDPLDGADERIHKAFALFSNFIFGMLLYWSRGKRQQAGRSMMQVKA